MKGKNLLLLLLSIVYFATGSVSGQPRPYKFNYLTVDEGLSHTDANYIAQDGQGYIWVATYFGLDRYDGYSIKKYYNKNAPLYNAFKNRLKCIYPDERGNIWLGTEGGLQRFDVRSEKYFDFNETGKKTNTVFNKLLKPAGDLLYGLTGGRLMVYRIKGDSIREQAAEVPPGVQFSDMACHRNGFLYLSGSDGLWALGKNGKFKKVVIGGFPDQVLSRVYADNRNNLVITNGDSILLLNRNPGQADADTNQNFRVARQYVCPSKSHIKNVVEYKESDYWVGTANELFRLDSDLNLIQVVTNNGSSRSLNSHSLAKILIDRSDCLWVCTFGGGVNFCDLNEKLFYTLQHEPEVPNSLSGNHIRSILEEGQDLWIGTNSNGLNRYDLKTGIFTYFNTHSSPLKLKSDAVTALAFDNAKNLWIGTSSGIEILKPGRQELWRPPGYDKFPAYGIETIVKDCYGNIWFGNHVDKYGVIWKDKGNVYHIKYYDEGYYILADKKDPQLFISSTQGLKRIVVDKEGNIIKEFRYTASDTRNSLSSDYTYPTCRQNDSTWWIGTIGGGLDCLTLQAKTESYSIRSYTADYGIFNDVESLEIDNAGNLWMGGNGLECLNPRTGKLIRYDKNDGLQGNSFKVGSSFKGADGRLYFGGINGLNYFYPDQIRTSGISARPVLTDILINNEKPLYGIQAASDNSLQQPIGYSDHLTMSHLQNNFVVFFSSMCFSNPLKSKYRYKLTGYDQNWKYTDGKNPSAAYSNLDYKQYTFVVEATNDDGIWSSNRAGIAITITPPWWKSDMAKIVYILLIVSGLSGIYFYQARWFRLKRELEVRAIDERKREEMHGQREELYRQQLTFFTNVSHEFRTPLTLIMGPLESLMKQNKNTVLDNSYQLMYRNAKRLINLISELMNFKKVSDSAIRLQVRPLIIGQFCRDLAWEFQNTATSKDIDFKMTDHTEKHTPGPLAGFFDVQILEKILFNLLNNSFKYTNVGGKISFEIFPDMDGYRPPFHNAFEILNEQHRAKRYVYFRVSDTGIGISDDSITRIFDRYYRVSENHLGSGVGLALVKSLTRLHKGDIYVSSERNKGTEIIIGIPWEGENYSASERADPESNPGARLEAIDNSVLLPLANAENGVPAGVSRINKHILLVDDNQELRVFLKKTFEEYYYIYVAEDGNSAMEIAIEKVPDLIICDVMMPGMSGIELCKLLKERFETSHIPFIILSAKDALSTKIEGMQSGADFYFAKPVSIDLLLLTVHNIFEQSEKLKLRYTNNYLSEATELVHSEKDKAFLNNLLNIIEDNIADPGLDADFLCERLYLSRTKLYQKIKSISDQSVGEFIRTIRLKKAIQIMTHEDVPMNEVVDRIGLQSSSNFSRTFKKEFGKSPLQFMQSLKNNGNAKYNEQ